MENNFDKIQKNAGVNTKLNQFAKLANQMNPISESVRKLIEMQDKLKFVIPDFDIPVYTDNFSPFLFTAFCQYRVKKLLLFL